MGGQYYKWLLPLPANSLTINKINDLRPELVHYNNQINSEMISGLIIELTLVKT